MTMLPFGNTAVTLLIDGQWLKRYLEYKLQCYERLCNSFVQVSGLRYAFRPTKAVGSRLQELAFTNGTTVNTSSKLTLTVSRYMFHSTGLFAGAMLFGMSRPNDGIGVIQHLQHYIRTTNRGIVSPQIAGRITVIKT